MGGAQVVETSAEPRDLGHDLLDATGGRRRPRRAGSAPLGARPLRVHARQHGHRLARRFDPGSDDRHRLVVARWCLDQVDDPDVDQRRQRRRLVAARGYDRHLLHRDDHAARSCLDALGLGDLRAHHVGGLQVAERDADEAERRRRLRDLHLLEQVDALARPPQFVAQTAALLDQDAAMRAAARPTARAPAARRPPTGASRRATVRADATRRTRGSAASPPPRWSPPFAPPRARGAPPVAAARPTPRSNCRPRGARAPRPR